MPRRAVPLPLTLCLSIAASCDDPDLPLDGEAEERAAVDGPLVVYRSVRTVDSDGEPVSSRVSGDLTPEIYQRAGRPWSYLDEPYIYHENAWSRELADGGVEYGHEVVREDNPGPVVRGPDATPTRLDPRLSALLASDEMRAAPATPVDLFVRLRDFPEWDIPLMPPAAGLSSEDVLRSLDERDAAVAARTERLDEAAAPVIADITALGGEVVSRHPSIGWLRLRVPWSGLARLAGRADISVLTLGRGTLSWLWAVGEGRQAQRLDAARFWTEGFDGGQANPGRHGFGRVTVGVVDNGLEDEACVFFDGADCAGASRIQERFKCADTPANYCVPLTNPANFAEADEDNHGTSVSSVILGDYRGDQACGKAVGDPDWVSGCHNNLFENLATGMAPEARLMFFAVTDESDEATIAAQIDDAINDAIDRHVDIVNLSLGLEADGTQCNPKPLWPFEAEAEAAYDDGILVVSAAGNAGLGSTSCTTQSPGDVLKTLAVNGFASTGLNCATQYHTSCRLDGSGSARGGADALVNGSTRAGALTLIDVVAPTEVTHATQAQGDFGDIREDIQVGGSSHAAPHVSGLAALIKDQYLAAGQTWVNSPGRLHTLMLAQTDRHFSADPTDGGLTTSQRSFAGDKWYGLGRMKMRLLGTGGDLTPWANNFRTWSFTPASADSKYFPFGGSPLPAGVELVKCVMHSSEGLALKDDISDIDLKLRVLAPDASGDCSHAGTQSFTRSDLSYDVKSMVAIEAGEATLAGKCVEVTHTRVHVTSSGVTTHTQCYFAGKPEDA